MANPWTEAGIVVEAAGIVVTGLGLYLTWKDNAPPERQVRRMLGQFFAAAKCRLRGRKSVTVAISTSWGAEATVSAAGVVTPGLQSLSLDMSQSELMDAISRNFDSLHQAVVEAHGAVIVARRERDQTSKQLRQELIANDHRLLAEVKSLAVDGIPIAVGGLALALIGLLLQAIGTIA